MGKRIKEIWEWLMGSAPSGTLSVWDVIRMNGSDYIPQRGGRHRVA